MEYSKKILSLFVCLSYLVMVVYADGLSPESEVVDQEPAFILETEVEPSLPADGTTALAADDLSEDDALPLSEQPENVVTDTAVIESDPTDSNAVTEPTNTEITSNDNQLLTEPATDLPNITTTEPQKAALSGFKNVTATAKGNSILITWEETDAMPITQVVLYRATEPITESSILNATIVARIPAGKKIYTDKVTDSVTYYYGIMPENDSGAVTFYYNPLENTTTGGVSVGVVDSTAIADILSIDAQAKDNSVVVRYTASRQGARLILYRSTAPLTDPANLVSAVIVSLFTDKGLPFVDYPIQGIPCYYGLIDEERIRTGTASFAAGVNATITPVYTTGTAPVRKDTTTSMRSIPLPYLTVPGITMPAPKRVDPETERAIKAIIDKISTDTIPVTTTKEPYLFPEEEKERTTGEASFLMAIIRGNFAKKQWNTAATELHKFLELHRSDKVTARAHFYLGETYFFSGMYREALTEFLFSRSLYYAQSQEWIQYTLNKLDTVPHN